MQINPSPRGFLFLPQAPFCSCPFAPFPSPLLVLGLAAGDSFSSPFSPRAQILLARGLVPGQLPGLWQSWGCEFSIQRAESLNPLLGDRWIIRNFICWAGNKQLCIFCCFADVSWGNSDAAPKLQGWVFSQLAWLPAQVSGKAL